LKKEQKKRAKLMKLEEEKNKIADVGHGHAS